jgi:hypothetical protein
VLPYSPITYSIALNKVQEFALHGTAKVQWKSCERSALKNCSGSASPALAIPVSNSGIRKLCESWS